MNLELQSLVTLLIVAVAASVLLRRVVAWWRGQSTGCGGGCSGCRTGQTNSAVQTKVPLPIVELDDKGF